MSKIKIHAWQDATGYIVSYVYKDGDDLKGGFVQETELPIIPEGKFIDVIPDFIEKKFNFVMKDIKDPQDIQMKTLETQVNTLKLVVDELIFGGGGL